MLLSLIAAMSKNHIIGVNGRLPWHLPADMKHFRQTTAHKPIIMGRKTLESIGRPLPKRHNIILTRNPNYQFPGCTIVHSVSEALAAAGDVEECLVGGGYEIYKLFLPRVQRMYLTFVDVEIEGDTSFPTWVPENWVESQRSQVAADERHAYSFSIVQFERRLPAACV